MMSINQKLFWIRLSRRIDQRPKRERMLIAAAAIMSIAVFCDVLFVTPSYKSMASIKKKQAAILQEGAIQEDQIKALRLAIEEGKERSRSASQRLKALEESESLVGMVPPEQMQAFMSDILPQRGSNMPRVAGMVAEPPEEVRTGAGQSGHIYRHRIRLDLEGGYGQFLNYLQYLNTSKWKFAHGETSVDVKAYPVAKMVVRLDVINDDPSWMKSPVAIKTAESRKKGS